MNKLIPRGAPLLDFPLPKSVMKEPGPIVVTINPRCERFAEVWFERLQMGWNPAMCEERMWLCLLNGAYTATEGDALRHMPRYEVEQFGQSFAICDTHQMSKSSVGPKYRILFSVGTRPMALKVAKALNKHEGYQQPKSQRRR